jgi:hypothetical protein
MSGPPECFSVLYGGQSNSRLAGVPFYRRVSGTAAEISALAFFEYEGLEYLFHFLRARHLN